jgi:uncharacterized protein
MSDGLEETIRQAYAAFGRGDVDGYLSACSDDIVFHVPGSNALSGTYSGRQGIYDLAATAMSLSAGTFAEEVEDILGNGRHAVVLARHRLTRNGVSREYSTAHVYEIAGGKLARCYEQPRDPSEFEEAWGPPPR